MSRLCVVLLSCSLELNILYRGQAMCLKIMVMSNNDKIVSLRIVCIPLLKFLVLYFPLYSTLEWSGTGSVGVVTM